MYAWVAEFNPALRKRRDKGATRSTRGRGAWEGMLGN